MALKLRYSPQSNRDLEAISAWIASDDPRRAVSFIEELRDACAKLVERPFIYPPFGRGLRKRTYRDYLILYRVSATMVTIARVIHGSRQRRVQH